MKKSWGLISLPLVSAVILVGCGSGNGDEGSASGEDYPSRDIELLVGHGPGGGTDIFARTVAESMEEQLDTNINVVNMEGAGGAQAKNEAANREGDGHSIIASSAFATATASGNYEQGLDGLRPVARLQADTFTLQVQSSEFEDYDAFVEASENEELRIGGVGSGDMDEITASRFIQESGLNASYVSFNSSGDAQSALISGNVDALIEEVAPSIDYIESGDISPIIFFAEERVEGFEDITTTVEEGIEITEGVERGIMVPRDTPDEIVEILEENLMETYESEEYQSHIEERYLDLREGWMSSEEWEEKLQQDVENYEQTLQELNN